MIFQNTIKGKLLKRYKRFFSDVLLESGEVVVAHTPNTGPMTTCWEVGMDCILTRSDDPKRKLAYTLQMTKNEDSYILVNTHLANKVVAEALDNNLIKEINQSNYKAEFKIGNSRFDFAFNDGKGLLEVKNVSTVINEELAIFPDTVSDRALKHVLELTKLAKEGFDCHLLFLVGREDCSRVSPAKSIMPNYYEACLIAKNAGVNIMAYQCRLTENSCSIEKPIPVILD